MNIPRNVDPLGNRAVLPEGYTRIAYLMPMVNTSRLNSEMSGWPDLGCRVRGFFDSSRTSSFPSQWFVLMGDSQYWNPLVYHYSKTVLGYRMEGGIIYPQQNGLPDVSSANQSTAGYPIVGDFLVNYNWLGDMQWQYTDANKSFERNLSAVGRPTFPQPVVILGRGTTDVEIWSGGIREVSFSRGEKAVGHAIPVLDDLGQPIMWDLIRRIPLKKYSDGDFIAGIDTQAQFNNMLRKLPDRTGQEVGILQVRLADALQTEENLAALDAMIAKNWEISQAA